MITEGDIVIALSNSGESDEILAIMKLQDRIAGDRHPIFPGEAPNPTVV